MIHNYTNLLPVLNLFDGEGGSASASGDSAGMGETNGQMAATSDGDLSYGEDNTNPQQTQGEETIDKAKAFEDLVNGEYKDIYTKKTQEMINRRFKDTKKLEKQISDTQPLLDILKSKYKADDIKGIISAIENDDTYWEEAADEAGMSIEQYKRFQKLERENKELLDKQRIARETEQINNQVNAWQMEAEELRKTFPEFDLGRELENQQFVNLIKSGVPIEHAYKVMHMDEIASSLMIKTAQNTEKRVVDNIRSKGNRPKENGLNSQSGFTTKKDVSKLTKADRQEIARRVARGEQISF